MTLLGLVLALATAGGSLLLTTAGQGLRAAAVVTSIVTQMLENSQSKGLCSGGHPGAHWLPASPLDAACGGPEVTSKGGHLTAQALPLFVLQIPMLEEALPGFWKRSLSAAVSPPVYELEP
ncbi:Apolipoprotein L6 [Fukomys damarensis]|uniref:Apolipoprotein L6 n=1 Tax=Fukomys damarensis TaxID=885580 RepID=A0A091CMW3_FUKDA|nr:Apolipoprotein L6 [Fukomys damarensis]